MAAGDGIQLGQFKLHLCLSPWDIWWLMGSNKIWSVNNGMTTFRLISCSYQNGLLITQMLSPTESWSEPLLSICKTLGWSWCHQANQAAHWFYLMFTNYFSMIPEIKGSDGQFWSRSVFRKMPRWVMQNLKMHSLNILVSVQWLIVFPLSSQMHVLFSVHHALSYIEKERHWKPS